MHSPLVITILAGALSVASSPAAQTAHDALEPAPPQRFFSRDRSTAVKDRPQPGYEPRGLRLAAVHVYPRLLIDMEGTDNVHATPRDAQHDLIVILRPEVSLETRWPRHGAKAHARGAFSRHSQFAAENVSNWSVGAQARLDLRDGAEWSAGADHDRLAEPRWSSAAWADAAEPVRYSASQAFVAASRSRDRLRLAARIDWRRLDYDDVGSRLGGVIDQDGRDRDAYSLSLRVDHALSPTLAAFIQWTGDDRRYDGAGQSAPPRDSRGGELLAGADFEITSAMRGEVAIGALRQDFVSPSHEDVRALGLRLRLEWFASPLTTLTAAASRTVEDSALPGSGGHLASRASLRIDHELRRNLILSGHVQYVRDAYADLDRIDARASAGLGAAYRLNRRLGVNVTAFRLEQSSTGLNRGVQFSVDQLLVSLVNQF